MAKLSDWAWGRVLKDLTTQLDRGEVRLYTGGGVPLATLRFPPKAFEPLAGGGYVAKQLEEDPKASGSGRAAEFRVYTNRGELVMTGSVGSMVEKADMRLKDPWVEVGGRVTVSNFVLRPA